MTVRSSAPAGPSIEWRGPEGCEIRCVVNPVVGSLVSWLELNVDQTARGQRGLAILFEAGEALNTTEWREDFLAIARQWHASASRLEGFSSWIRNPTGGLELLTPDETLEYIRWVRKLLRFAEIVFMSGAEVKVH